MRILFIVRFGVVATAALSGWGAAAPQELDAYNVVWSTPSRDSAGSMPLGGGDLGANVWVENGDLMLYAQESGAFDKNGECLKLGRFRVHLEPNPFNEGGTFRQELKVRQGNILVSGETGAAGKVAVKLWIEVQRPILHIEVESARPTVLTASYESWRTKDVPLEPEERPATGRRSSIFDYDGYQKTVVKKGDVFEPGAEGMVWFHDVGADFNAFDFSLQTEGLSAHKTEMWDPLRLRISGGALRGANLSAAGVSDGVYAGTPFHSWHFRSRESAHTHRLEIVSLVRQPVTVAAWKAGLDRLTTVENDLEARWKENVTWWEDFWNRSYIVINPGRNASDKGWRVGKNYQLFRQQLGGNVTGEAPVKFNGGNLTFDARFVNPEYDFGPDYRRWGSWTYTAANQQLVYWAYLKSGDFAAMRPQFQVYRQALGNAVARTRAHWGHGGASFAEQFSHAGMPAASHYGFVENGYAFFQRPRDFEDGEMSNPWISTLYAGELDFATMILEYQRYSEANIQEYIPFLLACLQFYDEHYQMIHRRETGQALDAQGKLVIFPSTPGEHHLRSTNPADAVAGLQAITDGMQLLPEGVLTQPERKYVTGLRRRIPGLPMYKAQLGGSERTVFAAAEKDSGDGSSRAAGLFALFPYGVVRRGSAQFGAMANTWKYLVPPAAKSAYQGWQRTVIMAARLGFADEAQELISKKLEDASLLPKSGSNNQCRFPTFWGPGYDWTPDHNWGGSGMIGLQDMLLQTNGRTIYLLPAWPRDWDVNFRLHAPQNTVVEGKFVGGKLIEWKVTPVERTKDVVYLLDKTAN